MQLSTRRAAASILMRQTAGADVGFCTIRMEGTFVPTLAAADCSILLIYGFFMLAAGFSLRPAMTRRAETSCRPGARCPAGRAAWPCWARASGSEEVLGMGAAGARYGLASMAFFALGSIPAMLFAGLYLDADFYGSNSTASIRGKSQSDRSAIDSGVSRPALRPENSRAECIHLCRDVRYSAPASRSTPWRASLWRSTSSIGLPAR